MHTPSSSQLIPLILFLTLFARACSPASEAYTESPPPADDSTAHAVTEVPEVSDVNDVHLTGAEWISSKGRNTGLLLKGEFLDMSAKQVPLMISLTENSIDEIQASLAGDSSLWFKGISAEQLSQAERNARGVVTLSKYQNAALYKQFQTNFAKAGEKPESE